jgi:hypothetical protein
MAVRGAGRGFRGGFRGASLDFGARGGSSTRGRGRGHNYYDNPPPQSYEAHTNFTSRPPPPPSIFPVTLQTLAPGELKPKDRHFPSRSSLADWVQSAPGGALKAFATHKEPETIIGRGDYRDLDLNRVYGIHYLEVNLAGEVAIPIIETEPLPREGSVEEAKAGGQDDYADQSPEGVTAAGN